MTDTDLPGLAIFDHYHGNKNSKLFVHDQFGPKVEMPVSLYFRDWNEMPALEKDALKRCTGKVLDIGAGAGSHALELQKRGTETEALEISPAACKLMKLRCVETVHCADFFSWESAPFDTLLLLMNGIGLCGTIDGFRKFLQKARTLLKPDGKIVFDSCDIAYMYEGRKFPTDYYGQVKCRYEYQKSFTNWFHWLYLDAAIMQKIAAEEGFASSIILEDENSQYLAELYLE